MYRFWFDDWIEDKESGDWAYVCKECVEKYGFHVSVGDGPPDGVTCGIKECQNEAAFYINFDGHEFGIKEETEWSWPLVITYGGADFIVVRRPAWSTEDTLETVRERPENKEQRALLETLVRCANNWIEERHG